MEFRQIKNYEGLYSISDEGKVWSHKTNRWLAPIHDKDNYIKVNLYKEGKMRTFQVHRLTAEAFIPNPEGLPEVNHINEIKDDNRVENLEWCTRQYNQMYSYTQYSEFLKNAEDRESYRTIKNIDEFYERSGWKNVIHC